MRSPYWVSDHAIRRAEERFPALGRKSREDLIAAIRSGVENGTLVVRSTRMQKGKQVPLAIYMIGIAGHEAVAVVAGNAVITVLTHDEYINKSRVAIGGIDDRVWE